jgi:hypothetical protein
MILPVSTPGCSKFHLARLHLHAQRRQRTPKCPRYLDRSTENLGGTQGSASSSRAGGVSVLILSLKTVRDFLKCIYNLSSDADTINWRRYGRHNPTLVIEGKLHPLFLPKDLQCVNVALKSDDRIHFELQSAPGHRISPCFLRAQDGKEMMWDDEYEATLRDLVAESCPDIFKL